MRLKECDLDLPHAEKSSRLAFRSQTRCMTALYERCLPRIVVSNAWKILVECVPVITRTEVRNLLGVFTIEQAFDATTFFAASVRIKKERAIEVVHAGALEIARERGWSTAPLVAARAAVIERDYINAWTWPKRARHDNASGRSALIECVHDVDHFRGWIVVRNSSGAESTRRLAIEESPDEFLFVRKLGTLDWSGGQAVLKAQDGSIVAETAD